MPLLYHVIFLFYVKSSGGATRIYIIFIEAEAQKSAATKSAQKRHVQKNVRVSCTAERENI